MDQLPLEKRFLSEEAASRLYSAHRDLKADPDEYCPTCAKKGFYLWPDAKTKNVCNCEQQLQWYKHYLNAGIGVLYQRLSWPDLKNQELIEIGSEYLDSRENMVRNGMGIVLLGSYGVGKTLFSMLMMKELLHCGYSVYATTFAGMIEQFTAGWKSKDEQQFYNERVRESQILLIDDIGKEFRTSTNLGVSTFDSVLRYRVQSGNPTFITSNFDEDEINNGYGGAVMSLLLETSWVETIEGEDFRKKAGRAKHKEALAGITRPIAGAFF